MAKRSGLPVKEDAAGSGPIADDVSGDDVVRRYVGDMIRGTHDDFAAGQALPDKVIRLPDKFKGNAGSQKSPEALPRTSGEVHRKRIFRQAARPEFHHQLTGKFRPYRPVHIADVAAEFRLSPFSSRGFNAGSRWRRS